jgi:hypothetical protein
VESAFATLDLPHDLVQLLFQDLGLASLQASRLTSRAWRDAVSRTVLRLILHLSDDLEAASAFAESYTAAFPKWERLELHLQQQEGKAQEETNQARLRELLRRVVLLPPQLVQLEVRCAATHSVDLGSLCEMRQLRSISIAGSPSIAGGAGGRHLELLGTAAAGAPAPPSPPCRRAAPLAERLPFRAAGALTRLRQLSQLTSVQLLGCFPASAGLLPALSELPQLQQLTASVDAADWQWLKGAPASGDFPALESLQLLLCCSEAEALQECSSSSASPPQQLMRLSFFTLNCSTRLSHQQVRLDASFQTTHRLLLQQQQQRAGGAGVPGRSGSSWSREHSAKLRGRTQQPREPPPPLAQAAEEHLQLLLLRALEQLPSSSTASLALELPLGMQVLTLQRLAAALQPLTALQHLELVQVSPGVAGLVGPRGAAAAAAGWDAAGGGAGLGVRLPPQLPPACCLVAAHPCALPVPAQGSVSELAGLQGLRRLVLRFPKSRWGGPSLAQLGPQEAEALAQLGPQEAEALALGLPHLAHLDFQGERGPARAGRARQLGRLEAAHTAALAAGACAAAGPSCQDGAARDAAAPGTEALQAPPGLQNNPPADTTHSP